MASVAQEGTTAQREALECPASLREQFATGAVEEDRVVVVLVDSPHLIANAIVDHGA